MERETWSTSQTSHQILREPVTCVQSVRQYDGRDPSFFFTVEVAAYKGSSEERVEVEVITIGAAAFGQRWGVFKQVTATLE